MIMSIQEIAPVFALKLPPQLLYVNYYPNYCMLTSRVYSFEDIHFNECVLAFLIG